MQMPRPSATPCLSCRAGLVATSRIEAVVDPRFGADVADRAAHGFDLLAQAGEHPQEIGLANLVISPTRAEQRPGCYHAARMPSQKNEHFKLLPAECKSMV